MHREFTLAQYSLDSAPGQRSLEHVPQSMLQGRVSPRTILHVSWDLGELEAPDVFMSFVSTNEVTSELFTLCTVL